MTLALAPKPAVPVIDGREEVVATCRRLLAEAEAGQVCHLAYAALRPDRSVSTGWSTGRHRDNFSIMGALQYLSWRIGAAIDDGEDVPPPVLPSGTE